MSHYSCLILLIYSIVSEVRNSHGANPFCRGNYVYIPFNSPETYKMTGFVNKTYVFVHLISRRQMKFFLIQWIYFRLTIPRVYIHRHCVQLF